MKTAVFSASVTGPTHLKRGAGCDDTGIAHTVGKYGVLVCSDGAGSASRSQFGSRVIVETFQTGLSQLASEVDLLRPGEWVVDSIVELVIKARRNIKKAFPDALYSDFHATLVACLAGPEGGLIIHIGDGFGCAITKADGSYTVTSSEPENGEYINETFFLTQPNWIKHLRVTPFTGTPVFAATMTDGAHVLFQSSGKTSVTKIVETAEAFRRNTQTVEGFLGSELSQAVSGDDKTLCLLTTSDAPGFLALPKREIYLVATARPTGQDESSLTPEPYDKFTHDPIDGRIGDPALLRISRRPKLIAASLGIVALLAIALSSFFVLSLEEPNKHGDIRKRAEDERKKSYPMADRDWSPQANKTLQSREVTGDDKNNNRDRPGSQSKRSEQDKAGSPTISNEKLMGGERQSIKLNDGRGLNLPAAPNLRNARVNSAPGEDASVGGVLNEK